MGARDESARRTRLVGQRETERAGNKSKGERERIVAREGRERVRAGQGTVAGRESGATRGRRPPPPPPPPPPGSAFRISSRSVLGGFSQSADAPRNAVIISIVCSPFSGGGGKGAFPPHSRSPLSPSSIFRITPSLALSLRSRSRSRARFYVARYARAASVRLLLAPTDADPLTRRARSAEASPPCCRAPRSSSRQWYTRNGASRRVVFAIEAIVTAVDHANRRPATSSPAHVHRPSPRFWCSSARLQY